MGEARGLNMTRRAVGWIPSAPRCKLCQSPLRPPGSSVLKLVGLGPSRMNRRLCRACFRHLDKMPGGAEIELSLLFADVRGSTALAERIRAQDYSKLISRFYGVAARVIDDRNGHRRQVRRGRGRRALRAGLRRRGRAAADASGLTAQTLEARTLRLRGRDETVDAVVATA